MKRKEHGKIKIEMPDLGLTKTQLAGLKKIFKESLVLTQPPGEQRLFISIQQQTYSHQ